VGADKLLAQRESSTLGFALTLFAVGALGVLAAVLASNRAANNTLSQQSLGALRDSVVAATREWPFATASVPGVAGKSSGLFLRFSASGEPRQCFPVVDSLKYSGLAAGAWALLQPFPSCSSGGGGGGGGGGAAAPFPVDQFTLACSDCAPTAAAALSFTLPYSCQSIFAEAGAVDADGSFATLALPPAAGAPGALLSALTWNLAPLLSFINNTVDSGLNRRGWQLLSQGSALGPLQPLAPANGSLSFQQQPAGVRVTVTLPLQPFAATTTLKELTSVIQLISSIVGFQAPVFAIAGILFGLLAASRKQAKARSERGAAAPAAATAASARAPPPRCWPLLQGGGRRAAKRLAGAGAEEPPQGAAQEVALGNPLHAAPQPAPAAAEGAAGWRRESDGGDEWFVGPRGEVAWELPPGAALAAGAAAQAGAPGWRRESDGDEAWFVGPSGEVAWELPPGAALVGAERGSSGAGGRRRSRRHRNGALEAAAPEVEAPAPPRETAVLWHRVGEGDDSWFASSAGDVAWELPPGAVVEPEPL
jgi:hypothetical protein